MDTNPVCERCGGLTHYEGNVTAPNQTIYGCATCGRQTWVRTERAQAQQQQQPQSKTE